MVTTELLIVSAFKVLATFVRSTTRHNLMQRWIHYVNSFFSVAFHCSICYLVISFFIYRSEAHLMQQLRLSSCPFLTEWTLHIEVLQIWQNNAFYVLSFHRVCWKSIFLRALLWSLSIFVIIWGGGHCF